MHEGLFEVLLAEALRYRALGNLPNTLVSGKAELFVTAVTLLAVRVLQGIIYMARGQYSLNLFHSPRCCEISNKFEVRIGVTTISMNSVAHLEEQHHHFRPDMDSCIRTKTNAGMAFQHEPSMGSHPVLAARPKMPIINKN